MNPNRNLRGRRPLRFVCGLIARLMLLAAWVAPEPVCAADDVLIADFEGPDYGPWKVEGEAFGPGPARGTLPNQMVVDGFLGKGLVNTYFGGDGTTGVLTSPPFKIQRKFINFLIGGGGHQGQTCINLLVDGQVVRTAVGPNTQPGGSERLRWHSWDVGDLLGRQAVIQIVDRATGGWGHINVDHIFQSDEQRRHRPATRDLVVEKRYLHVPVKTGAPKCRMQLVVAGRTVRDFEIELAPAEPDFWIFCDVSAFRGQPMTVLADSLPEGSKVLQSVVQSDEVPGAASLYKEKHRPQFHFSSRRGWNNDPNGLVFYKGEYHLFYQHNPYGWPWGNMHWGHAVSRDLVHWQELPIAIYPYKFGDWAWSGSAVVDVANTAGFKTGDEDVIVAAYTSTGRGECIVYSNDRGRTFTEYAGNPVVRHRGRDPKIIWYAPGRHWVMAVYDEKDDSQAIAFYTSTDLKAWTFQSRIEGYFECPEIFELPIDGDPGNSRWVVYAADGAYAVGRFDGKTFTPDHPGKHRYNWGNAFYASQTFNNIPPEDGRRIQIAWGKSDTPGMPFNQCMLFPVVLTLRSTEEGPRLFAEPVREIERLHTRRHFWEGLALAPGGRNPLAGLASDLFHIRAEIEVSQVAEVGLVLRGTVVSYDAAKGELACKGCKAPLRPDGGKVTLEVLLDRTTVEVFANRGRIYMPVAVIPPDEDRSLAVFVKGGQARFIRLEVWELKSAWQ